MNERVVFKVELYKQALKFAYETAGVDTENGTILASLTAGRFAELIVRECAGIGDNYQDILGDEPECFNCRKVAYGIVDKIRQHFGVEE